VRPRNSWPGTDAERSDRHKVVELVSTVGERKLVWTVFDLRKEIDAAPRLQLAHSDELGRHVQALDDALITRWDQRLDVGEIQSPDRQTKRRHQYVLTRRVSELEHTVPDIDDLERVYFALWVAVTVIGVEEVPTTAVTDVLRNVEGLALVEPRNTANHLTTLNKRNQRAVERDKPNGSRWVMWRPLGDPPSYPHFERWVRAYASHGNNGNHVAGTGHATINSLLRELVILTIRQMKSSHWPAGRSVQIADIRTVAGADPRAGELTKMLRERGRDIGSCLGDATKETVAGLRRVNQVIVKVGSPMGGGAYYDVPDEPGFERRRLVVNYRELKGGLSDFRIQQIEREYRAAERLLRTDGSPVVHAIAAARQALAVEEFAEPEEILEHLEQESVLLSKAIRKSASSYRGKLDGAIARLGQPQDLRDRADEALKPFGLDLETVSMAGRPLMTPDSYAAYVPQGHRRGLTSAELVHRVKALRRFPNPDFVRNTDEDPSLSARYCVDRVEALCYLSERHLGRVFPLLREGALLLGSTYRHPDLLRQVARDGTARERRAARASLVLLGDPEAVNVALEALGQSSVQDTIDALHMLLVMQRIQPDEWPPSVRGPRDRMLRDAVVQVVLAARTERWLLQR
jgi:hypothetical protein